MARVSVVIPAYNAERSIGPVLAALTQQEPPLAEIIVVDDRSEDRTAAVSEQWGARVVRTQRPLYAGGSRNRGWDTVTGDFVAFLDDDVVAPPDWSAGVQQAVEEFPGSIIGCALTFAPVGEWDWVSHLQFFTPYLPTGAPRDVGALSSGCLIVPREAPLRWDQSYGGEDGIFSVDALNAGYRLIFDPRFSVEHRGERSTFGDIRQQQRRLAYGMARCAAIQREGLHKRIFTRVPVHYFALARLLLIYRRLRRDASLRPMFLRLLPRMVLAEWAMGCTAVRYAVLRPRIEGDDAGFR
jgi:glycosyltransferase involved in cell wall biosynthesis